MLISQAELDLIVNPRIRKRVLHLPVRRENVGRGRRPKNHPSSELSIAAGEYEKRCPMRVGGVYTLRARPPYESHRNLAAGEPTRARAVLRLIDLCSLAGRTEKITVREVKRETIDGNEVYTVRFVKGDQAGVLDQPVYLSKYGDYTTVASRQSIPGDPEVMFPLAADIEKARQRSRERRLTPEQEGVKRIRDDTDTLLHGMVSMKRRNRLRLVQKELDKIAAEAEAEAGQQADDGGTLAESVCAARQASASQSGPRQSGSDAQAPLESAA